MLEDGEINEKPMGNLVVHPIFRFGGKLLNFRQGTLVLRIFIKSADFESEMKLLS